MEDSSAAIKLIHQSEETEGGPMFGDGDGDGEDSLLILQSIKIEPVNNGWMITTEIIDENGEVTEIVDVFNNSENFIGDLEAVKHIIASMDIEGMVEIKE